MGAGSFSSGPQLSEVTIKNYHELNVCHVPGTLLTLTWITSLNPLSKLMILGLLLFLFTDDKTEAYSDEVFILGSHW